MENTTTEKSSSGVSVDVDTTQSENEHNASKSNESGSEVGTVSPSRMVLSPLRLQLLNFALCTSLFLSTLESTIVGTALVPITNDLEGFNKSSWIANAYLLTYTAFLVIMAKMSDIFGRRTMASVSLVIFIIASLACGFAQTLTQLITFRAFQGIGGGGIYSMVFVILPEMVTATQYALYATIVSSVFAVSSLLGPILGGLISDKSTWRWIFWLNAPLGALALLFIFIAIPSTFPYANPSDAPHLSKKALLRLDILGTFLVLAASALLLTALEEGGIGYSWSSPLVLSTLIVSLFLWISFILWSKFQASRSTLQEPILPWIVLTNRFCLSLFFAAFWVGGILYSSVVALPQMFMVVHGTSASGAGYRLLPFTLCMSVGSGFTGWLMQKKHVPPFYLLVIAAVLQILGVGLMMQLETDASGFQARGYGFEAILGVGLGMSSATTVMSAVLVFRPEDLAVGMGGIAQFRTLGGCIGISICINILNKYTAADLASTQPPLSAAQIKIIQVSASVIDAFPELVKMAIRRSFARGFLRQAGAMTAFGGMELLVSFLLLEKPLRRQM